MKKKIYYYVTGNTAEGFINHLASNVKDITKVIIISHPSAGVKTAWLKKLINIYQEEYSLEILRSDLGNPFIDGIIIRDCSLAIISDRIDCLPADRKHIFKIEEDVSVNEKVYETMNELYEEAYQSFSRGLRVHDDLEAIYIQEMDVVKGNALITQFIEQYIPKTKEKEAIIDTPKRFFGTTTGDGMVTDVPNLIEGIPNVFHIKGRAGTGKSYFMRKIMDACLKNGIPVEEYRCSFDPNSVDMIRIPELQLCMLDSTDPHAFEPKRTGEHIIDLYTEMITPGTDEKYEEEITIVTKEYKDYMLQGVELIKQACAYYRSFEKEYNYDDTVNESDFQKLLALIKG
ncbi:hypothetical protein AB4Y30_05025 [Ornithinibacillus sp. 4-3]|uniref:DNA helicase n=1 Tax=Ornithinibacillus sp. 4-3 TaxID=3231488 RepID=A0AB39HVC3_9BACI